MATRTPTRRDFLKTSGVVALGVTIPYFFTSTRAEAAASGIQGKITGFKTKEDALKVNRALLVAMDRFFTKRVIDGTIKSAHRNYDRAIKDVVEWDDKGELRDAFGMILWRMGQIFDIKNPRESNILLTITGKDLGKSLGQAGVGILRKTNPRRFEISLNKNTIQTRTEPQLGGTIFHEMLHNEGGLGHLSGNGSYEHKYAGFIIKEWGLCIAGNGSPNLGLTGDRYARWDE